jgi:hypothetical protein
MLWAQSGETVEHFSTALSSSRDSANGSVVIEDLVDTSDADRATRTNDSNHTPAGPTDPARSSRSQQRLPRARGIFDLSASRR